MKLTEVLFSRRFEKQLTKLPFHIQKAAHSWTEIVQMIGIREARKVPGFHDEPLKGIRRGQRSVRLNKAYRLIYREDENKLLTIITILEAHKHDY